MATGSSLGIAAPVEALPPDDVKRVFETNVVDVIRMVQAMLPFNRASAENTSYAFSSLYKIEWFPTSHGAGAAARVPD